MFALELTHDVNVLLPLLIAVTLAHAFTVLTLRRSILTEKVSRRGYHLSREYAVDTLEVLFVRDVTRRDVVALPVDLPLDEVGRVVRSSPRRRQQLLYPVVDAQRRLEGIVTRGDLEELLEVASADGWSVALADRIHRDPVVAYADESLRVVVYRMAETGLTRFPIVERRSWRLLGVVALFDLLEARVRDLEAERRRERTLPLRLWRRSTLRHAAPPSAP